MFFLLIFAAMIPVTIIDAPLPKIASTSEEIKKALDDEQKMQVSIYIDSRGFRVRSSNSAEQVLPMTQGKYPFSDLHRVLVTIHSKRPNTREVTLYPADDTTYDTMISVMDTSRELVKGDAGYKTIPPDISQKPESQQFNRLFPDVSIGGV